MGDVVNSNGNSNATSLCPICYEDMKPAHEILQAISICGHVFHQLCLQTWFLYCSTNFTCPVCKGSCNRSNSVRLYFQSVGDLNEKPVSQILIHCGELRVQVKKLEMKVSSLDLIVESQAKEIKRLVEENYMYKNRAMLHLMANGHSMDGCNKCLPLTVDPNEQTYNSLVNSNTDTAALLISESKPEGTATLQSVDPCTLDHCITIISGMKGVDHSLYNAAIDLFQDAHWRNIFISLKSERRLAWLNAMCFSVPRWRV